MRTLPVVVMTVALGTSAFPAFCQETDSVALDRATDGAQASAQDDAPPAGGSRSGFGQVMALLTGLLEDAAQREASDAKESFALDNPAVVVSVTPVRGADSFVRRDGSLPRDDDRRDDNPRDDNPPDAPRDAANARLAGQSDHAPDATPR